ncbi:TPA_asm: DNA-binding protein [Salmonella enterica subsp. enterica serovar Typhi str. CT18]|uniref:Single-stranded DNA-binding protein n=1 Tax=Salmonella enterica subsp. enterica serovar Typhi str. CT18 TaxID=220341 RepID=A0A717D6A0_SALTI|nr:single-stranded DNA-binding protein [Escherichia coli]ECE4893358.1 DNA-binding protein [Salmonella enterica]ECN7672031.1 DNA-binding protein [Salmonella enterica subsp. enterica serovar Typhi]EJW9403055.1 DNA-binding protein [Salmonella enterica subsp. enterica serovar Kentucky]HAD5822861.1 DNA-binding protein [Salmonella enterica subsp. enterica serovar Typhi str. CT18]HAD6510388.1 DNA-binding protein [Salmonella enterica subsp. enterica serovar Typhimurium str. SL1344]
MIKIEIKPSQVAIDSRSGISKKSGNPYTLNEQMGYAWLGGDYPELIKINLEDGQPPYAAGFYSLSLKSFRVGDFNRLQIARVDLIPADK